MIYTTLFHRIFLQLRMIGFITWLLRRPIDKANHTFHKLKYVARHINGIGMFNFWQAYSNKLFCKICMLCQLHGYSGFLDGTYR